MKLPAPDSRPRRAFTLMEMCAVISVLAITLGFGSAILILSVRANQVAAGTLRKVVQNGQLADRFRADVALASDAPERSGSTEREAHCLILTNPDGSAVIYRFADRQLTRTVSTSRGEQSAVLASAGPDEAYQFLLSDEPASRLVTLRMIETRRRGEPQTLDICAALGGDRR